MKKLLLALAILLLPSIAFAQCNGVFDAHTVCGNDTGSPAIPHMMPQSSVTGITGGTSGQTQYNNAGVFGGYTPGQDCTVNPATGAFTCLKTNNVAFGPFATGTNAANLTGTMPVGVLPPGVDTNVLAGGAVITSTPTVNSTFCGQTAALGGNAFYAFTVGAASGFPANCVLTVVNVDAWPTGANCASISGGRGKSLAISGFTDPVGPILYPTQITRFRNVNNVWVKDPVTQLVSAPLGQKFCADNVNGANTNDCLAAGTGNACKDLGWIVMHVLWEQVIGSGGSATGGTPTFDIRLATNAGCVTTTGVGCYAGLHMSGTPFRNEGHNSLMIECDGGSATNCSIADNTGNQAIGIYCYCYVEIQNVGLYGGSGNNNDIQVEKGYLIFVGGVVLGPTGSSSTPQLNTLYGGTIIGTGGSTISITGNGTSGYLAFANKGGLIDLDQVTVSWTTNHTYSQQTVAAQMLGGLSLSGTTWNTNANTITSATKVGCGIGGFIATGGTFTSIPGTANALGTCTSSNNGQYN